MVHKPELIARAYKVCYGKVKHHHTISTPYGQRWVSAWDRLKARDGVTTVPLHPLFGLRRRTAAPLGHVCCR